jgi:L-ascorbate metabolism protein UlaG (beta-lactamase superfamily)
MKITRYFQSCLLVEEEDARLLIDPSAQEAERVDEFGYIDAVLYTHEHADHFDAELADKFREGGAQIYANQSTAAKMANKPNIMTDGDEFEVKGLSVQAIELPHCLMWDGSDGPQNTGYYLGGKLFHPGDGKELADFSMEVLAVPITGPDISLKDALDFAKQVKAKTVIPIHYDYIGTKAEVFASVAGDKLRVDVLDLGESIEL